MGASSGRSRTGSAVGVAIDVGPSLGVRLGVPVGEAPVLLGLPEGDAGAGPASPPAPDAHAPSVMVRARAQTVRTWGLTIPMLPAAP